MGWRTLTERRHLNMQIRERASTGLGDEDFRLQQAGGAEFPDRQCIILDRALSCGRASCGCGGINAVSGLWKAGRAVGAEPVRRQSESGTIAFFKHLNSVVLGRNQGAMMIAEESTRGRR